AGNGQFHFENFFIKNSDPDGGGIRIKGGLGSSIRDCGFECNRAITLWSTLSTTIDSCLLRTGTMSPIEQGTGPGRSVPNSVGIAIGHSTDNAHTTDVTQQIMINRVDLSTFEFGIRHLGPVSIHVVRTENCSVGIVTGMTEDRGEFPAAVNISHW